MYAIYLFRADQSSGSFESSHNLYETTFKDLVPALIYISALKTETNIDRIDIVDSKSMNTVSSWIK